MGNSIEAINPDGDAYIEQNNQLLGLYFRGKAPNTLKLNHETKITPPPLPIILSNRTLLVKRFISKLHNSTLLHIKGGYGTGKTQLCNLLINDRATSIYWFRVREYKVQIKTFITELNNLINNSQGFNLFKLFSNDLKIETSSILILDDLPNLTELRIEEEFIQLVMNCEKHNIKIISSSNYGLPERINQYLRFIESVDIPLLTDNETTEILDSYKAPDKIKQYAKLINLFSDSHPALVIATINYLESNDWKMDFDKFFKNKFIENELENFQIFLDKTVDDKQTKELIYRLNNIGRTVTEEEIQLVSSIEPKIDNPFIKIGSILNIWMFKESDKEYLLSPLIYKLGSKNLDLKVEQKINLKLGNYIFDKGAVNPYEISKGINYYIKARELNIAGFRLFESLYSAMKIKNLTENDMFSLHSYWVETSFPIGMGEETQLLLRTVQIILHNKFGNNTEKLYEDYLLLESKIQEIGTSPSFLLMTYMLFSQNNYRAFEYGLKLSDKMNTYSIEDKEKIGFPDEFEGIPIDVVFLLSFEKLNSLDEFKKWIFTIKKTEIKKLIQVFDSDIGKESVQPLQYMIIKKLIIKKESHEIQELYKLLIDVSDYMYSNSIIYSWASLIASAVDCLIEEGELRDANGLIKSSLQKTDNEDCKLIINHNLSMKYVDKEDYANALLLYKEVIDIDNTSINATLVDALTYASISFGCTEEYVEAKKYIEKSINLYKSLKNHDELLLSKLYGEYSIILWHLGLEYECLLACKEVLTFIEKNIDNMSNQIKAIEVMFGHNMGYYFSILTTGTSPESIQGGDEYLIPRNRTFIYTGKELYTLYSPDKVFLLYYQFYNSFYQLNDKDNGITYLHKSFESSTDSPLEDLKTLLYKDIYLVENNFIEYFKFTKSLMKEYGQDITTLLLQLSLLKLATELYSSKNKIKEFKTAFINFFSEDLEKEYYNVIIYTLDKLNGQETYIKMGNEWLTQRVYLLSEVHTSSIDRVLEIHELFYTDFFGDNAVRNTNIIKIEVIENYFFTFWISKINVNKSSFSYANQLLERLNENYAKKDKSNDKVLELLKLVDRYKKR